MAQQQPSDGAPASQPTETPSEGGNVYRQVGNLLPYPFFSLDERERRWHLVRQAMEKEHVDCLLLPGGSSRESQADARYLTHVGGGGGAVAAVFPLVGEPAAIVGDPAIWLRTQPWCTDFRDASPSQEAAALAKLRELSIPNRRMGIVGLRDSAFRAPETLGRAFVPTLARNLGDIQCVDFTEQVEEIRIVKSREEIAFLEKSMEIVDASYAAVVRALRPGVVDQAIWGTAVETICGLGSEIPGQLQWVGDHHPNAMLPHPTARSVESGWLFLSKIEAAWGGYQSQGSQPFACGQPDPAYSQLMRFVGDVWNEAFTRIRPGVTPRELRDGADMAGHRLSPSSGPIAGATVSVVLRGQGLGSDAPVIAGPNAHPRDLERTLAPGWCFVLRVAAKAGRYSIVWGDTVLVTQTGARRLGKAAQEIMISGDS